MKKNKKTFQAEGKVDNNVLVDLLISSGSPGKGEMIAALQQLVENAYDAGATRIWIHLDRKKGILRVCDNGEGFGKTQYNGFYCLFISEKREWDSLTLAQKKKKFRDFIGKNGSGRIFALQVAKVMKVVSLSAEFKTPHTCSLVRDDLVELISAGTISRDICEIKAPDWFDVGETGSAICLENVDWNMVPSVRDICALLPEYLSPSLAQKVTVEGQSLDRREVIGDVIHEQVKVKYLTGPVHLELYIPKKSGGSRDRIRLGAHNQVSDMQAVTRQLPPFLRKQMPRELLSGVCGDIFMPEVLKNFVAHDRQSFNPELFSNEDLILNILRFFREEVAPRIRETFERKQEIKQEEADQVLIGAVCDAMSTAFEVESQTLEDVETDGKRLGGGKKKPSPKKQYESLIVLNLRRVTMMPGETQELKVVSAVPGVSGKFVWEVADSGGSLDDIMGKTVEYTAGRLPGKYNLIVRDAKNEDMYANVTIRIVAEKHLLVSPMQVGMQAGQSQTFRLRNAHTGSGDFMWQLDPVAGLELSKKDGLVTVLHTSRDVAPGDYQLWVTDQQDPSVRAKADISIEAPTEIPTVIRIEDDEYEIRIASVPLPGVTRRQKSALLDDRSSSGIFLNVMEVDTQHQLFVDQAKIPKSAEAKVQLLLTCLVEAHLLGQIEDGEEADDAMVFNSRRNEILGKIMAARASGRK